MKLTYLLVAVLVLTTCTSLPESGNEFSVEILQGLDGEITNTTVAPTVKTEAAALTPGQRNAIRSADRYLKFMAFSRSGLIEQLEFKHSTDDATFAVNSLDVDWNEQAALSADEYLAVMSFSRGGLIDQLVYEGFTIAQAAHGATAVGLEP